MAVRKQEPTNPETIKTETLTRAATIDPSARAEGSDDRRIAIAFSSEEPVDRWFGTEVLGHKSDEIRLEWFQSGRAPLLLGHDTRRHVGVVEATTLGRDGVLRGTVRLGTGALADEALTNIRDGILVNASVGYRLHRILLQETDGDDETYRAVDWEPFEISLVAIPADQTVGVGRGDEIDTIIERGGQEMPDDVKKPAAEQKPTAAAPAEPVDTSKVQEAERSRIRAIMALGERHNLREAAEKAVEAGQSLDEFREYVLDNLPKAEPVQRKPAESPDIGLSEAEARQFSFVRAMNALANPRNVQMQEAAAFEFEVSRATEERTRRAARGFLVPADVLRRQMAAPEQRDLVVGTPTAGGNLVATDLLAASFIDLLRNRLAIAQLGATMLTDLNGDIAIPRQTGGATAYWVAEGSAPTESQQAIDQVTLTPKTVGAYTDYSRKLLLQSSIDVEAFVRTDLSRVLALAIDLAALEGSGASNQPLGVKFQSGINRTTFAADNPTFAEVVELETEVAADNADIGTLGYACNARMRGHFKTTEKFSGSNGMTIWEPGNTLNGYRTAVSNQVTLGDLFFGNWADLLMGMWGALDIMVDPYALSTSGGVRIIALQSVDTSIRHKESFGVGNNAASAG